MSDKGTGKDMFRARPSDKEPNINNYATPIIAYRRGVFHLLCAPCEPERIIPVRRSAARHSIQVDILVAVPDQVQIAFELRERNDDRRPIVIGMETEARTRTKIAIEKQVYMILRIVDQPERRHRPGQQPQITFHALLRCERQLSLMQPVFEVVNCHVVAAVEADQIVAVTLVVAEKEILAVRRAVVVPILAGDFDRRRLGMFIPFVTYAVRIQIVKYDLSSFHIQFICRLKLQN